MTPYDSAVLANSPLAYWPLTETSGTTAADLTGHGFGATYPTDGTISLAQPGPGGGCLSCVHFNDTSGGVGAGLGSGIAVAAPTGLPVNPHQVTIEAWLNPQFPSGVPSTNWFNGCVLSWGVDVTDPFSQTAWVLQGQIWAPISGHPCAWTYPNVVQRISRSPGFIQPGDTVTGGSSAQECPSGGWTYGTWHHFAVCVDRDTPANCAIYVDGVSWGPGVTYVPFVDVSGTITFGLIGSVQNETWQGGIANLALYTTCLTQTQVQAHYTASICPAPSRRRPNTVVVVQ